jgi:hypothetical protein
MELDGWDNLMIRRTGNFGGNILGFEDEIFMKMGKSVFSVCFLPLFIQMTFPRIPLKLLFGFDWRYSTRWMMAIPAVPVIVHFPVLFFARTFHSTTTKIFRALELLLKSAIMKIYHK